MKLFESKTRLKEADSGIQAELSDKSWETLVTSTFGKKYLEFGKSMPFKDINEVLRTNDVRINGAVIGSNIRAQKTVEEFLSKKGWEFTRN